MIFYQIHEAIAIHFIISMNGLKWKSSGKAFNFTRKSGLNLFDNAFDVFPKVFLGIIDDVGFLIEVPSFRKK